MTWVTLAGVKELTTDQTGEEEGVDSESHHLRTDPRVYICLQETGSLIGLQ